MSDRPRIFLSPPHMSGRELVHVTEAFESNYIAPLGPKVNALEEAFCAWSGHGHALALNSGTAAMHLVLRHLGVGAGDVVVASTLTFVGSVAPAAQLGAELVFVDAEEATWNMDPAVLEDALRTLRDEGRRVGAVVPTDLYGQCCDYDALQEVCDRYSVPLVIDAAESLGASYKDRPAGHAGRAAIYSMNGNKIITSSGGGMLMSDDEDLVEHARKLSTQAREPVAHYEHTELGYNYRMSNVVAGVGLGQMEVLAERVAARGQVNAWYRAGLAGLPGVQFLDQAPTGTMNNWLTVIRLGADTGRTPEQVRLALEEENVETRPVWKPMHQQPVFAGARCFGGAVSEALFADGLCLPSGSALDEATVSWVVSLLRSALEEGGG